MVKVGMVYIAADHHGYKAIGFVERFLKSHGVKYENLGVKASGDDMRLEDLIPSVTKKVLQRKGNLGILSCGTGIGMDMGANRFAGIRACLATSPKIAEWSRVYDNCNVLCLVGWNSEKGEVGQILNAFLGAKYDGSKKRLKTFKAFDRFH